MRTVFSSKKFVSERKRLLNQIKNKNGYPKLPLEDKTQIAKFLLESFFPSYVCSVDEACEFLNFV